MKDLLSITEYTIMDYIWDLEAEEITAKDISEHFNNVVGKKWKKQTISTFLKRLVNFGCLMQHQTNGRYYYTVCMSRMEYNKKLSIAGRKLMLSPLTSGFFTCFNKLEKISKDDIQELHRILDDENSFED